MGSNTNGYGVSFRGWWKCPNIDCGYGHTTLNTLKNLNCTFKWDNYMVHELYMNKVLEKAEEPEIKLPTSAGSSKRQESSRKTSISALLTMPKPLTVRITTNCGKFWKRCEYQTTWPASWEICMQVRKQQLDLDMEQQTGLSRKRSTSRLYIVTLLI